MASCFSGLASLSQSICSSSKKSPAYIPIPYLPDLPPPPPPIAGSEITTQTESQTGIDTELNSKAITSDTVKKVVKSAAAVNGPLSTESVTEAPVACFYDLDVIDSHIRALKNAFQPDVNNDCQWIHCLAMKSCPLTKVLKYMVQIHGPNIGLEAASIGEFLHGLEHVYEKEEFDHSSGSKSSSSYLVFDSPAKTERELEYAILKKAHVNLDNFDDWERCEKIIKKMDQSIDLPPIGFRLNPLVGAGQIKALSVSTSDSKFGIPLTQENRKKLIEIYRGNRKILNSVHVHVGSGGMGVKILCQGVKTAVDFAKEVNGDSEDKKIIRYIDIGGGLPSNYASDYWGSSGGQGENNSSSDASSSSPRSLFRLPTLGLGSSGTPSSSNSTTANIVPTYFQYATALKQTCPELFNGYFERVVTEFGQSVFSKLGFLASKVEFVKEIPNGNSEGIAVGHFGADCCLRQAYTTQHKRRIELVEMESESKSEGDSEGSSNNSNSTINVKSFNLAGPLCFQGDFVSKEVPLPSGKLSVGDFVVLKDAGSNTLSLFSHHCSRFMPPVWGYRCSGKEGDEVDFYPIRSREETVVLRGVWG